MQTIPSNRICAIIGLGYVDLSLPVEFSKQHKVIGFNSNAKRVAELQAVQSSTLATEIMFRNMQ